MFMTKKDLKMLEETIKERDELRSTLSHVIDEIYFIERMMNDSVSKCQHSGIDESESLGGVRTIGVLKDILPDYNSILKEEFSKREKKAETGKEIVSNKLKTDPRCSICHLKSMRLEENKNFCDDLLSKIESVKIKS
jgi:hypothetical protein